MQGSEHQYFPGNVSLMLHIIPDTIRLIFDKVNFNKDLSITSIKHEQQKFQTV